MVVPLHEKLAGIDPNKSIRKLRIIYAVSITIAVGITISLSFIINTGNDLPNITTLVLEVTIAIIITWTVFVYTKKWDYENKQQQKRISKILENIEKIEKVQHNLITEQTDLNKKRKEWIIKQLKSMLPHFKSNLETLENNASTYQEIHDPQQKDAFETLITSQEELSEYYNNRLRIIINQSIGILEPEIIDALERIVEGAGVKVRVHTSEGKRYERVYYQHILKEIDSVIENIQNKNQTHYQAKQF